MALRDKQLEEKIQNRLERLGISNLDIPNLEEGYSYLEEVLYVILSEDSADDIIEAFENVSIKKNVVLHKLRADVESVVNMINIEVLKSFYKSEDYNLKLLYDKIALIADDILMN